MKKRGFGFKDALRGICHAVLCERNFRVHIVAILTVIYFASVFGVDWTEKAILAVVIACVMAAELVNTAIEAVVDKLSPEKCTYARIAKDCAAGAVLVLAVGAFFVAIAVFGEVEGWMRIFRYIKEEYIKLIIFALLGTVFIFAKLKDKEKSE